MTYILDADDTAAADQISRGRAICLAQADARSLPLSDNSIDLVVTSPPYFGLRSYQDGGKHYGGQIGSEPTPYEFLDALIECTREWMRVVKPTGSIWVNLGDKYVAGNRGSGSDTKRGQAKWAPAGKAGLVGEGIMPKKSLMGLPWRYALRCMDDLGLILRAEVIWSKPNGLPESVTDRVRRSHEQWFHFTLQQRYYSAIDELREPHTMRPQGRPSGRPEDKTPRASSRQAWPKASRDTPGVDGNPLGKIPGSVWSIPTQPLRVPAELGIDHFAAFPMEWPRRLVSGWSPRDVCTSCGEGRKPIIARDRVPDRPGRVQGRTVDALLHGHGPDGRAGSRLSASVEITGYACACPDITAPATPGTVLDPFGGTGTTALVAATLGRTGISLDASADYCRLAQWRTHDPKQRERAARSSLPSPRVSSPA